MKVSIKTILGQGQSIADSDLDELVKPLFQMTPASRERFRYEDEDGFLTVKGYNRLTTKDWAQLNPAASVLCEFKRSQFPRLD